MLTYYKRQSQDCQGVSERLADGTADHLTRRGDQQSAKNFRDFM